MNTDQRAGRLRVPSLALVRPALLMGLLLGGCGGDTTSPGLAASSHTAGVQGTARMPASQSPPAPAPARTPSAPAAGADKSGAPSPLEVARLARMRALPILSVLSDREKLGLLRQLPDASPLRRLRAIDGYPRLDTLGERQKEILLGQLEDIVPVTTPAKGFVCECGNGVVHRTCVRESCLDRGAVGAVCYQACGRLPMLNATCSAAPECARGR